MDSKKPTKENFIPPPLRRLTLKEIFLFSKVPVRLLKGYANGTFRPNQADRKSLTLASIPFYKWDKVLTQAFIQRKKYRILKKFITLKEREDLFARPETFAAKLDPLIKKHWDDIVIAFTEKDVESAPERS